MRYCMINPYRRKFETFEAGDFTSALERAGLPRGECDFGSVCEGLTIVVYEFGLTEDHQPHMLYFGLARNMYAGHALLYSSRNGDTIDFNPPFLLMSSLVWLGDAANAERAIVAGVVERPYISVNGEVVWVWRARGAAS